MFALKPISQASITGALAKAERYRLLNEPNEAESICRDILEVEPDNRNIVGYCSNRLERDWLRCRFGQWRLCGIGPARRYLRGHALTAFDGPQKRLVRFCSGCFG